MPDHRIRLHPVGAPQLGQRQLHAHQHRLHPGDPRHRLTGGEHLLQRKAHLLNEHRLQLGDRRREHRLIGQQLPAHPRPLRTLTRIHEHRARPARPLMRDPPPRRAESPAASARSPATACARSRAHTVANFRAGCGGDSRCGRHRPAPPRRPSPAIQSASTPAIDATRSSVLPETTNVVTAAPVVPAQRRSGLGRLLQHHMRIGAAEPERRHPGPPRTPRRRPGGVFGNDFQPQIRRTGCADWASRNAGSPECVPRCTASTALMKPAIPAAASR